MIRKIKKADRKEIARLLLVIFEDMELPFLAQFGEEKLLTYVEEAMEDPDYRFSDRRGICMEIDGKVVGVAYGYPDKDEAIIDKAWEALAKKYDLKTDWELFIESEVFPDEWYLDSVCVNPEYRGYGVGTQLIDAMSEHAQTKGYDKVGLCCDFANNKARRLYERIGFEIVGEQVISNHPYYHMQKNA